MRHSVQVMPTRDHSDAPVFHNFIDGRWTASQSGELFENRNPADTGDLIGRFQQSTP
jgi:alpha-ketoglutaric semialdehyde dehydrogenase